MKTKKQNNYTHEIQSHSRLYGFYFASNNLGHLFDNRSTAINEFGVYKVTCHVINSI